MWAIHSGTIDEMTDALERFGPGAATGPLSALSVGELRERRNELQRHEQTLSYLRRLVQGRLDIVLDELHHRTDGSASRDLHTVVDELPKILAEHHAAADRGALPEILSPPDDVDDAVAELDHLLDAGRLGSLSELDDTDLRAAVERLGAFERKVSERRHAVHLALDAVQEEIVLRYKTGEASVDALIP